MMLLVMALSLVAVAGMVENKRMKYGLYILSIVLSVASIFFR